MRTLKMAKSEKSKTPWYFLLAVIAAYIITIFIDRGIVVSSLLFSYSIAKNLIIVLLIVFIVMVIINYFITTEMLNKYIGRSSGIKRWIFAIIGGIISTGPIYMWYPMLKQLRSKGVSYGFISAFLYNRAVKIPLLPMMVFYFGVKYVIVLTIVMIVVSVLQGMIFEKLERGNKL